MNLILVRIFVIYFLALYTPISLSAEKETDDIQQGRKLAQSTDKGNCLACHMMPSDTKMITSATIGPPLIAMKARFPNRDKLREQIWDATKNNPNTVMPPYGKHKILSDREINLILDYLYML